MKLLLFITLLFVFIEAKCPIGVQCMRNERIRACKNETKKLERLVKKLAFKNKLNDNRITAIESTLVLPELPSVQEVSKSTNSVKNLTAEEKAEIEAIKKDQTPSSENSYVNALNSYVSSLKPVVSQKQIIKRYIVHSPCTGDLCKFLNKKLKVPKCKDNFKPSQCMKLGHGHKVVGVAPKQKCLL